MDPCRLALAIRRVIRSRRDLRVRGGARRTMYVARRATVAPFDGALVPSSPPPTPASPTPPAQSPVGPHGSGVGSPLSVGVGSPRDGAVGSTLSVAVGSPLPLAVGGQEDAVAVDPHHAPPGGQEHDAARSPAPCGPALAFLIVTRSAGVNNSSICAGHAAAGEPGAPYTDGESESTDDISDSVGESEQEEDDPKIASDCSCGECEDMRLAARDDMRVQMEAEASAAAEGGAQVVGTDVVEEYTPATPEYTPGVRDDDKGKQVVIDISDDDDM